VLFLFTAESNSSQFGRVSRLLHQSDQWSYREVDWGSRRGAGIHIVATTVYGKCLPGGHFDTSAKNMTSKYWLFTQTGNAMNMDGKSREFGYVSTKINQ
jgi:hypothetical protein